MICSNVNIIASKEKWSKIYPPYMTKYLKRMDNLHIPCMVWWKVFAGERSPAIKAQSDRVPHPRFSRQIFHHPARIPIP